MKKETRVNRLAEMLGIDIGAIKQTASPDTARDKAHAADSVTEFVKDSSRFTFKNCGECGRQFAYAYGSIGYCSNRCRKDHLNSIGIQWNPEKPDTERWGIRTPLLVPPEFLQAVKESLIGTNDAHLV